MGALPYAWAWPVVRWVQTGRRRYRRQPWTGKVVLQVEFSGPEIHFLTGTPNGMTRSFWRDARVEDLLPTEEVTS